MAAPHVAGVAALIRARWPASTRSTALRNKIESCLFRSVDNIGPYVDLRALVASMRIRRLHSPAELDARKRNPSKFDSA
jgi:subtilisin family serine protease